MTRILRCWWVLFTAVPFGLLAFAAFLYAGVRSRRWWWLAFAVFYLVVMWVAFLIAAIEELPEAVRQTGGGIILLGWPLAFIHALVLAPRFNRAVEALPGPQLPPLAAGSIAPPVPPRVAPPPPPAPPPTVATPPSPVPVAPVVRDPLEVPGWKPGWAGGRIRFGLLLLFGAALSLVGVVVLFQDPFVGAAMLLFGTGTLFTLPTFRTWRRRGHVTFTEVPDRPGRVGLYFPYSVGQQRAAGIGLLLMACACVSFLLGDSEPAAWVAALLGASVLALNAVRTLSPSRRSYVALLQDGVAARIGSSGWFVPWKAIADVRAIELRMRSAREHFVGVAVNDTSDVDISRGGRALMRLNRWLGADLSYTTRSLEVDPALLLYAMHFYWRTPDARVELVDGSAVSRVERFDLFGAPDSVAPPPGR